MNEEMLTVAQNDFRGQPGRIAIVQQRDELLIDDGGHERIVPDMARRRKRDAERRTADTRVIDRVPRARGSAAAGLPGKSGIGRIETPWGVADRQLCARQVQARRPRAAPAAAG